jgi:AcrR family transcriptional regulator
MPGYAAATIEQIAACADVAVETVYSRFRSKSNLLTAILDPAVVGTDDNIALLDLPASAEIRAAPDQLQQVRLMAHLSRTILERTAHIHRILETAASSDPGAAELQRSDRERRYRGQSAYIDMLLANGPLRNDLTRTDAADTYATLANPAAYAFLTEQRGWTPSRFEDWLCDGLTLLLLP